MDVSRRWFLRSALAAPAIVSVGSLMPISTLFQSPPLVEALFGTAMLVGGESYHVADGIRYRVVEMVPRRIILPESVKFWPTQP